MGGLQGVVLFVILLGVLITVHEFGHFIVAKLFKVKVIRFSIGFGPKLFGFTKGETEYQVATLPLGGYVKMAGELPHDEIDPKDAARGFLAQTPWKRACIVAAGPVFNFLFAILVYFIAFLQPQELESPRIRYVQEGLPAAAAGIRPGDKIAAVDGTPVATFREVLKRMGDRVGEPTKLTIERDGKSFEQTLTPTASFEGADIESRVRGSIGISPNAPVPMIGVEQGTPAYAAGLRSLDIVLSVNGKTVADVYAMQEAIKAAGPTVSVQVLRREPLLLPGIALWNPKLVTVQVPVQANATDGYALLGAQSAELFVNPVEDTPAWNAGLRDGDRIVSVNGKPVLSFGMFQAAVAEAKGQPFQLTWRSNGAEKTASVQVAKVLRKVAGQEVPFEGVGVGSNLSFAPTAELVTVHPTVADAIAHAATEFGSNARTIVVLLKGLVLRDIPISAMGGPLAIYQLTSKATELGAAYYFGLMAFISVNLGIVNLVPIPVLDGFGLVSAMWEGIRRRPIPTRTREIANLVGLALLLMLFVRVMISDVMRF